jgi:hypothetical protein
MTLQDKIDRYLRERAAQPGGRPARVPPLSRLLWALGLDVPPPAFWPAWLWLVAWVAATAAVCWAGHAIAGPHWRIGPIRGAVFGVILGAFYAQAKVAAYRRLALSSWYGTSGNAT